MNISGITFEPVIRDQYIDADLENSDLLIKTDSTLEGNERIKILIFDKSSDVNIAAFWITFVGDNNSYHVGKCSESGSLTSFSVAPPSEVNKIWKISKGSGLLEVFCNDQKMLDYKFDEGAQSGCATQWGQEAARIKFPTGYEADTASDMYALVLRESDPITDMTISKCCLQIFANFQIREMIKRNFTPNKVPSMNLKSQVPTPSPPLYIRITCKLPSSLTKISII